MPQNSEAIKVFTLRLRDPSAPDDPAKDAERTVRAYEVFEMAHNGEALWAFRQSPAGAGASALRAMQLCCVRKSAVRGNPDEKARRFLVVTITDRERGTTSPPANRRRRYTYAEGTQVPVKVRVHRKVEPGGQTNDHTFQEWQCRKYEGGRWIKAVPPGVDLQKRAIRLTMDADYWLHALVR